MKKTICLLWVLLIVKGGKPASFDPSKFDYCSTPCKGGQKHSACNCERIKSPNEITSDKDIDNFRKQMVELHNDFRNLIASGGEPGCPQAANMMVLNYDFELEYLSRCYGKIMSTWAHDKCRKMHNQKYINTAQNLYSFGFGPVKRRDYNKTYQKGVTSWYNEIKVYPWDKKEMLSSFQGGDHGHFTAMVWATATHVGCAMAQVPGSPNTIICEYAGQDGGANFRDEAVYDFGKPCSRCPNREKCNTKYPALCGTLKGIGSPKKSKDTIRSQKGACIFYVHLDITLFFICILSVILQPFCYNF